MENFDFEASIKRLEEINEKLSSQSESLDDSMKLFEEGLKLIKLCNDKLENFEVSINDLLQKYQGE